MAGGRAEALDAPDVGVHDDFFEPGGHSVPAVRLMAAIQMEFAREPPAPRSSNRPPSDSRRPRRAEMETPRPGRPWVRIQPAGDREPFFRVHPVGGNVRAYMKSAREMGNRGPFYGLQSLGIDGGEPLESVEEMATAYIEAMRGWGRLAKGGLIMRNTPGDHYTVLKDPNIKHLARELSDLLP